MNEEISQQLRDTMAEILSWEAKDELAVLELDTEHYYATQDLYYALHPKKQT